MKKIQLLILSILVFGSANLYAGSPNLVKEVEVLKVSIQSDNLFIYMSIPDQEINKLIVHLNRGRRIILKHAVSENNQLIFYLEADEAYKLKDFGIRSISLITAKSGRKHIKLSDNQIDKIERTLP